MIKLITIVLSIIIIFLSCSDSNQKVKQTTKELTQKTKQNPLLKGGLGTINANTISYSYYLPTNYNNSVEYPIFIIFDPHASGNLPINLYKSYAEKYGYILVASNDSKNGIDYQQVNNIIYLLLDDVLKRFSIDKNRVNTMGFSGGARVASLMAFNKNIVKGCVLCGGGLMQNIQANHKVNILSFAGNTDFNLNELIDLNQTIPDSFYSHLIIFEGKHQWPDSISFEDAFYWTIFNEMRDSLRPLNEDYINDFYNKNISLAKKTYNTNKLKTYNIYSKIYDFLNGLREISDIKNKLSTISKTSNYKKQVLELQTILKNEKIQEQDLVSSYNTKDTIWWNNKITILAKDTLSNTTLAQSNKRILDYLGLVSYMQVNNALRQNQILLANKYDIIYKYVNPTNPEAFYMGALIASKQKNTEKVLKDLKQAFIIGFNDYNRLNNELSFGYLLNNKEFQDIINDSYN